MTLALPYLPSIDGSDAKSMPDNVSSLLDDMGARGVIDCVNWPEKFSYRPMATFSCAYSDSHIWIDFMVRCNYLKAEHTANQSPVSSDSCVEFFIDPKGDGEYWNFEFNCIGAVNASRRRERPKPTRLDDATLATILRFPSCGRRPFLELEGLFTWSLLVGIPLSLLGIDPDRPPETASCNFYKCASGTSAPHYLSWAPIATDKPDFHRPEFFAPIMFLK